MALTQEETPDNYHPFWHPSQYVYDSDIKTNDEFKYVFVIINAVFSPSRVIKVSPRIGDGLGAIDIRRHLQDIWNELLFDIKETSYQAAS